MRHIDNLLVLKPYISNVSDDNYFIVEIIKRSKDTLDNEGNIKKSESVIKSYFFNNYERFLDKYIKD